MSINSGIYGLFIFYLIVFFIFIICIIWIHMMPSKRQSTALVRWDYIRKTETGSIMLCFRCNHLILWTFFFIYSPKQGITRGWSDGIAWQSHGNRNCGGDETKTKVKKKPVCTWKYYVFKEFQKADI